MYALIQNDIVWQVFEEDPHLVAGLDVRDVGNIEGIAAGWVLNADGTYTAPPPPAPFRPTSVNSAQAKIQLSRAKFLPAVKAAVEAMGEEAEIWFADARTWQRDNPYVKDIGKSLGLSDTEIDDLFRDASQIDA